MVKQASACVTPPEKDNCLAVYVAYSDEAAIAGSEGEFLVAGYVAAENEWPWMERAWQDRVLDGPPAIPYLHMVEIRDRPWRNEHGLSYYQGEQRVDEAIRVLYSTGSLFAYASVIKRCDLRETVQTKYTRRKYIPVGIDQPDYACFMGFAGALLEHFQGMLSDIDRVDFVISEKQCVSKNMGLILDTLKLRVQEPVRASLIGNIRIGKMDTEVPLQAADVLCWHIQRYFSGVFDRTLEDRMWYLLKERTGVMHYWKREELEATSRDLEKAGLTR